MSMASPLACPWIVPEQGGEEGEKLAEPAADALD